RHPRRVGWGSVVAGSAVARRYCAAVGALGSRRQLPNTLSRSALLGMRAANAAGLFPRNCVGVYLLGLIWLVIESAHIFWVSFRASLEIEPSTHAAQQAAAAPEFSIVRVVSVNVGRPREVEWRGRTVRTSIFKEPVTGPVRAQIGSAH